MARRKRLKRLVEDGAPAWRAIARDRIWLFMQDCPYKAGKRPPYYVTARAYGKNAEGITVHGLPINAAADPYYAGRIPADERIPQPWERVHLKDGAWRMVGTARKTGPALGENAFILTKRTSAAYNYPQAYSAESGGHARPLYSDHDAAAWAADHQSDFDAIAAESFAEAMEDKQ